MMGNFLQNNLIRLGRSNVHVFVYLRSPMRPNLLAMCLCEIGEIRLERGEVLVRSIDARPGSPLIDIKPYLPYSDRAKGLRLPAWATAPKSGRASESNAIPEKP
jgi:tRNA (Thr-GGU) A37 N-methylase